MSRAIDIEVDALQDLVLVDTLYPDGTPDDAIDLGTAVPDNITGRSYEVVIHESIGDGLMLKQYTTAPGGGCTIPVGTDGVLLTTIPEPDLALLGPGDFVYYIRRTDLGAMSVVTKGDFSIVAV